MIILSPPLFLFGRTSTGSVWGSGDSPRTYLKARWEERFLRAELDEKAGNWLIAIKLVCFLSNLTGRACGAYATSR
jgi:hypothetical protein